MAQQLIGVGNAPNDGQGNPIRTAFIKCNDNFSELYARAQVSPPPSLVGSIGDFAGMYAYDSSYFYYCFANYDGSSIIWAQVTQVGNVSVSAITNGDSNIKIADINGNASISVNGNADVIVVTETGLVVTGNISATGNIVGNYILGNGSQLTGLPETYANSNVAAYLPVYSGNISANNITVTTSLSSANITATSNITGGNILSSGIISTSGNILNQGIISATGNIETAGYFVGTFVGNVTGNFVVPGSNTQIIFNTNGNADAVAGLTFDTNGPNLLTVLGTISSQGNVIGGNIRTAGLVTATGNITGGNVLTAGLVTATGNITGGNVLTAGLISATSTITSAANITGANLITGGLVTSTGNITGGNLLTAGRVSATANVYGGNIIVTNDVQTGGNVSATSHTGTTVSVIGNVIGGNLRTSGLITATGNVTGNYFIGNGSQLSNINTSIIQNGNSNIQISSANGNATVTIGGVGPTVIFSSTETVISGNASVTGNVTGANLVTSATVQGLTVTATGNVTGGNVLTGGLISATSTVTSAANITGANIITAGLVTATGNVTGGNIITAGIVSSAGNISGQNLSVNSGTVTVGNIINGNGNGVGNIGSSSLYYNTVFAKATSAQYADLAENYVSDAEYAPGTVVVFGGEKEITISTEAADERVAGVISTNPAHLMNAGQPGLAVALRGRVPVHVIGPVFKGDSLVTSSTSGFAQSVGRDRSYAQAVFAKAIETNVSPGEKIITAVIL
jgi:filamentous hemagglutinin